MGATRSFDHASRLTLDDTLDIQSGDVLAREVRAGLTRPKKSVPPKYFYDDEGSRLFDAICDTPEYYQTRTEAALLDAVSAPVVEAVRPTHLVELGSGACRKTRRLLDAMGEVLGEGVYVPLDVSGGMLADAAGELLADYPWLRIHGLVGDYRRTLARLPEGERRLVAFLGGTIGNYTEDEGAAFLSEVRAVLHPGDALVLGADLVKEKAILDAAYNDAEGLTARFNLNLLEVLNRTLDADFDPSAFEHLAYFASERAQVEMYLRSTRAQRVRLDALDLEIAFAAGETLHTEISRKFTRASVDRLLARAGFALEAWHTDPKDWFSLSVARPV
jgi:L-histidine Nalpha-methyltransferase